jgi:NAD(P) transhydrogenase subunit alpha
MYDEMLSNLAILVLSGFVGFAVISKVPNTLHTPLMSGTNAIHGIVVLGALLLLGRIEHPSVALQIILFVAVVFGTLNVIGGFIVTDRMLGMFKGRKPQRVRSGDDAALEAARGGAGQLSRAGDDAGREAARGGAGQLSPAKTDGQGR